jgi:hypothetical protein
VVLVQAVTPVLNQTAIFTCLDVVVTSVRVGDGAGDYDRMSLCGCRFGGLDEFRSVVAHAIDAGADDSRYEGRFR